MGNNRALKQAIEFQAQALAGNPGRAARVRAMAAAIPDDGPDGASPDDTSALVKACQGLATGAGVSLATLAQIFSTFSKEWVTRIQQQANGKQAADRARRASRGY